MRTPGFWSRPPGTASALLAPLGALYGRVAVRRMARGGEAPPVPVVCVGNFTAGGAGKTPVSLAVAMRLRALGLAPAFLSRGHGGRLPGPLVVDPARHGAAEVGDEPLLLAAGAPAIVARDRPAGARLAAGLGAGVVVMDDGLQNPSLRKTLALAVVDGGVGLGNHRVLPAGPLRAPLAAQWPLADALVVLGPGQAGARVAAEARARGLPVLIARLVPDADAVAGLAGRRVVGFAGIGRPGKFADTLRDIGAEVAALRAYPDHHPYRARDLRDLALLARRLGAGLVTTAKDAARLGPAGLAALAEAGHPAAVLPVTAAFDAPAALDALLTAALVRFGSGTEVSLAVGT